jgi:hypothetical protein
MPMKKVKLAFAIIIAVIVLAGSNVTTWYLTRCEDTGGTVEQGTPGPLSPTVITDNTPAGKYCGDKIDITGVMQGDDLFVGCRDNCKGNSRTFPMRAICHASVRPYSIMIQPFILAGYSKELKRFNALAGAELAFLWNYSRGSVGFGLIYAQGLIMDEYYVGAAFAGKIDFGKLKN